MYFFYNKLIELIEVVTYMDTQLNEYATLTECDETYMQAKIDNVRLTISDANLLEIELDLQASQDKYVKSLFGLTGLLKDRVSPENTDEFDIQAYYNSGTEGDPALPNIALQDAYLFNSVSTRVRSEILQISGILEKNIREIEARKLTPSRLGWLTSLLEKIGELEDGLTQKKMFKAVNSRFEIKIRVEDDFEKIKGGYKAANDKLKNMIRKKDCNEIEKLYDEFLPFILPQNLEEVKGHILPS